MKNSPKKNSVKIITHLTPKKIKIDKQHQECHHEFSTKQF